MANRCKFWLSKKNRFCANAPLFDSSFCGNHTQRAEGNWTPCPIDPSHSVLEENLESHVKRCPLLKQTQSLSRQPYYQKGINAGEEEEDEVEEENILEGADAKDSNFTSGMKRNTVYSMPISQFSELINKIKSVHALICNDIRDSFKVPEACSIWTNREVDKDLPFQEKHVLQQASILGNLEELRVLRRAGACACGVNEPCDVVSGNNDSGLAVVEFGAGRGYLTQMLADCYGINKVFLVERKSYKLKADRSLRQKESLKLERLRIDIEDLNLKAVKALEGVGFMAIGKHLCGPATDMTIRCCIPRKHDQVADESKFGCCLKGLAIATCCHHLCQWKKYINKKYMLELGFNKEDFHAISWFTSWAVDADHSSEFASLGDSSQQDIMGRREDICLDSDLSEVGDVVRNMRAMDRAVLGFMCKDIIDAGRLMWIKEQGLESQLVKYVPLSISPENRLLVAGKKQNP